MTRKFSVRLNNFVSNPSVVWVPKTEIFRSRPGLLNVQIVRGSTMTTTTRSLV